MSIRAISMTSCFMYRNFRERRRVSVDVQDGGGTHKPGSHKSLGVDTGGGLTDSGEKTSSSKSAVSLFLIFAWEIRLTARVFCVVEAIRRRHLRPHVSQQAQERSRPIQIRRQGRGEFNPNPKPFLSSYVQLE